MAGVDHWWLCGPFGMVTDAIEVLAELGVPPERIHRELFWVGTSLRRSRSPGGTARPGAAR